MPVGSGASTISGSQVSLRDYVSLVRDHLEDWEYEDRLSSTLTDSATTATVPNGMKYAAGNIIQIDSEYIEVTAVNTNTLTIRRGWRESSATAHSTGAAMLRGAGWSDDLIEDWVNESFAIMYPYLYIRQTTTLTGSSTDLSYDLPADLTESSQVEWVTAAYGTGNTEPMIVDCSIRSEPPILYIPRALSGYTLTLQYIKPFPQLSRRGSEGGTGGRKIQRER